MTEQKELVTDNLQRFDFTEHGFYIESEIQSLPLRIFETETNEEIGVCLIEAAGIGQGTVKLLYIDAAKRKKHFKNIHRALRKIGDYFGFKDRTHQRKKQSGFVTLLNKVKN